ncbi:MAG: hypothetical protein ACOCUW_01205 [Gemmatimonadota bacterium]
MIPAEVPYETAPSWTILEKFRGASRAHVRARQNAHVLGLPYIRTGLILPPPRDVAEQDEQGNPVPERKVVAVCTYREQLPWPRGTEVKWYAVTVIRADPVEGADG